MSVEERIQAALEGVRPHLQQDGGDVELVRYDADSHVAEVRFTGACKGCAMSAMTLRAGIERAIRLAVEEIRRVEAVS
ncbi:MAG: NifU family protein [Candidatus Kapabacteria bacterium]|jgi:Fe-S cluster biogenesis protein NfuA|nr:NifU family protein [Candidatus Kapabacteria bacterium]